MPQKLNAQDTPQLTPTPTATATKPAKALGHIRSKDRIWELDFLRGICVLLMIFDHTMFDIYGIFGDVWASTTGSDFFIQLAQYAEAYWTSSLRLFVEPLVVIIFCVLCGISCSFSHNNLKRGLEVVVCSVLVFGVTTLIESPIRFGILQMFSVAILSWWLIDLVCRHKKMRTAFVCLALGTAIVVINYALVCATETNDKLFTSDNNFAWVGSFLYGDNTLTFSADYQPIFPTVGYMLIGAAFAPVLYPNKRSLLPLLGKYDWYKPFSFWGKIALIVYVLHQVLIAAILALVSFLFITPGNLIII